MPLVNYESSDEDSHEDDNDNNETLETDSNEKVVKSSAENNGEEVVSNVFSRLPPPKTTSKPSTAYSSSLSDIVVNKSSSGPIKISVPSLKAYSEEETEDLEDDRRTKRFKGSTKGTGLSSVLPKPKSSFTSKSSSLIPQSLIRPKANVSVKKLNLPKTKTKAETENPKDSQKISYFFNEEEKLDDSLPKELPILLSDVDYGPERDFSASIGTSESAETSIPPSLDDMTYKRLIASKFGEEAPEQINIVDIDVSKHLSESKDWLKTISEEKEEEYTGVQPSSTARRKHQITYLALQAKQREVELKNEWARSRTTKTMSRAKYGF